ncbi:transporter [Limnohabitans sp. TS-CS-82]|uniref:Tim44 domain-containing protein n=1 Tax=Limnohabitans sp. TS-CS-82 TaxID=2094193 RepID=UPI000CF21C47|nr:Tim44-like domain-containing protein [Limnohabitans sp. TS-CS-82]PQA82046.1 transporter [Limnohabitans sp. TS-CS-82]
MKQLWSTILVIALAFTSLHADAAKRLGGGKSVGQQSSNVTQRDAAKPAPAVTPAPTAAPSAAPAAAQPKKSWGMGGMLGGLAAGLGLAWLAHSLGFGAEFGQFLMFGLIALGIMIVVGMVMRRRQSAQATGNSPFAFEGAGAPVNPSNLPQYNPKNVGNDASARPMDTDPTYAPQAAYAGGSMIGSGLAGNQTWGIPAGFDALGFVNAAKENFITLQQAWDRSDIPALRVMMTDSMLDEIKTQLAEREATASGQVNHTEVVMLDAQLLGVEEVGAAYMASVEFSGLIREDASAGPTPFREVWNMTKPKDGSLGWLVAGVQALQ